MAAHSLGKAMNVISNLKRLKVQTLGRVNDFERRAMLESSKSVP